MIQVLAKVEDEYLEYEYQYTSWFCLIGAFGVNNKKLHLVKADEFESKLNELKGKRVFLEPPSNGKFTNLKDFEHPEDCIYVFGNKATGNLEYVKEGDDVVSVDMKNMSSVNVFGISIAGIVLYDRLRKEN